MTEAYKNADRFQGFANLYNDVRPACPGHVVDLLTRYFGRRPHTVVDIGCGTGLSTLVWQNSAERIIGVDPGEDMLAQAADAVKRAPNIELVRAFSDATGLDSSLADIVTCSQSFHWMEPESTLREVARLLKPGGVFAAYDCDWPPVCCTDVELAYQNLFAAVRPIEKNAEYRDSFIRYPKEKHLENIQKSGHFKYTREVVFANSENCTADRYYALALSQGSVQMIMKREPALIERELAALRAAADEFFGEKTLPVEFCYRMRIGVAK